MQLGIFPELRGLTLVENEDFDKARQEEEKMNRMKTKLNRVRHQLDTIFSLYYDVLTC